MLKELKTLLPYAKRYRLRYLAGILFLILTNGGQLYIPQIIRKSINTIESADFQMRHIWNLMLGMMAVALLIAVGRFFWRFFILGSARRIERNLREDLFAHLLKLSPSFYKRYKTGDLMARATNDMRALRRASGMGLVALFDGVFMTMVILIILFSQYPLLTLFTILPLPLITLMVLGFGKLVGQRFKAVQRSFAAMSAYVQERIAGIRVIKSFVQEQDSERRFEQKNRDYLAKNMHLVRLWGLLFPLVSFLSGITGVILLGAGGVAVIQDALSAGDLVAFLSYLEMLTWPVLGVGFVVNIMQRASASMARINVLLNEQPEIRDLPGSTDQIRGGDIEVRGLVFSYPDNNHRVLAGVDLSIPEGITLGILGRTGSGKSTFLSLLLRLVDTPPGTIFLGGRDIRDYTLAALRARFGYVPQQSFLFSQSIKENIAFGSPQATDGQLWESAEVSTISRDLADFKAGWETVVGEKGVTLSGGQKQRVAISRAIAKQPEILIFDDALSAVDTETEEKILRHHLDQRRHKTNILVSHRISTLMTADRIAVFEEGKIIQHGTHQELIRQEGFYQEIYNLQHKDSLKESL